MNKPPKTGPAVLIYDIETAPLESFTWGTYDQNVSLEQIKKDWHILSWSAKWLGDSPSKIMYQDQRNAKNIEDDSELLIDIWELLDQADIVITQNGKNFDQKKLYARFVINKMKPPSSSKHIDTCEIARKRFGFTSNKLAYLADRLCKKYKKLDHGKFQGFKLWSECLKGNIKAWKEMEKYNKRDVLALEELYRVLMPWHNNINFDLYNPREEYVCQCGNDKFQSNGVYYTQNSAIQRFRCNKCGSEHRKLKNSKRPTAR
jgi:DNA polymerase elongation subunit (family B)